MRTGFLIAFAAFLGSTIAASTSGRAQDAAGLGAPTTGVQRSGPIATDAGVGVRTITFADGGGGAFEARIWYPTPGGTPGTHGASRIRLGYLAVRDGAIAIDGRAPVVILLHGSGARGESMAWIALGLAARGAIAVAADHPASAQGDPERRSILDIWEQPGDVSRLLDQLLRSEFGRYIDPGRIAVAGFSLGGASAMLLARRAGRDGHAARGVRRWGGVLPGRTGAAFKGSATGMAVGTK